MTLSLTALVICGRLNLAFGLGTAPGPGFLTQHFSAYLGLGLGWEDRSVRWGHLTLRGKRAPPGSTGLSQHPQQLLKQTCSGKGTCRHGMNGPHFHIPESGQKRWVLGIRSVHGRVVMVISRS